ncbi:hypothetical protein [Kordia sp.]|uniref:hypothetical protein n=1 Tax=Kordia sp. TaxID=1965332 RepID=UPI003D6A9170
MKKQNIKKFNLNKASISKLANLATGGFANERGTKLVCPTFAADRPGCPSFGGVTCEPTR